MSLKNGTWCVLEKEEDTNLDGEGRGSRSEGSWWWTCSKHVLQKSQRTHTNTQMRVCTQPWKCLNVQMSESEREKQLCLAPFVVQLLNFSSVNYPSSFYTNTFYVPLFSRNRFLLFPNRYWNLVDLEIIY